MLFLLPVNLNKGTKVFTQSFPNPSFFHYES